MSHRYFGTSDLSYRALVRVINETGRLSQQTKDDLIKEVDMLVGHMMEDFDFALRNQYGSYYCAGSKYLKARHWFTDSRDMLMEVALRALKCVSNVRDRFINAGFVSRI